MCEAYKLIKRYVSTYVCLALGIGKHGVTSEGLVPRPKRENS